MRRINLPFPPRTISNPVILIQFVSSNLPFFFFFFYKILNYDYNFLQLFFFFAIFKYYIFTIFYLLSIYVIKLPIITSITY